MKMFQTLGARRRAIRPALCLTLVISLLALSSFSSRSPQTVKAAPVQHQQTPETTEALFSNPAAIAPADRASNNAGTNPGLPPLYPSNVDVAGVTGTVTKVTIAFTVASTFRTIWTFCWLDQPAPVR
jgi:hypothetical protein